MATDEKIGDAANGQKSSLDGTEKLPITGSQWIYTATIKTYIGLPAYSSDSTEFLNGKGEFAVPPGAGGFTDSDLANMINLASHKNPPADSDTFPIYDTSDGSLKSVSFQVAKTYVGGITYSSDSTQYLNGRGEFDNGALIAINNLSDVLNPTAARVYLGMGSVATYNVPGAGLNADSGEVVRGDDTRLYTLSGDSSEYLNGKGEFAVPSGGGGGWTQTVNEDGSSFSNFTSISGTWSSDGTVIKQTDTSATPRTAAYNIIAPTSNLIFQADVQLKSSGSDRQGGLLLGFNGTNADATVSVKIREGNDDIEVERQNQAVDASFPVTINVDTWYTIRAVNFGRDISVYVDGTYYGSARSSVTAQGVISYIGLVSYQAEVWWRNIKAWTLTQP